MEWFLKVVRDNYANFNGRARRKEYWMFALFNIIFLIIAAVADNILGLAFTVGGVSMGYGWIYSLLTTALIIPSIAVMARRMHDIDKSGWMCLILFIPMVGAIWFLVLLCKDSNPGDNKYGPSPKASPAPTSEESSTETE